MADDEDDDFEDLFSFGAGGGPSSSSGGSDARASGSSGSDYDILSDVSLTTTTPGGVTPGATGGGVPASPAGAAGGSVPATPGSSSGGVADDFDSLFGTPPATPAGSRTPRDMTTAEKDKLLAIDETPGGGGQPHSMDDFHVHDEDTRDMLDWLDDDNANTAAPKKLESKGSPKDDDFDFDQMLAEADDGGKKNESKNPSFEPEQPQTPAIQSEETSEDSTDYGMAINKQSDAPDMISEDGDFNELTMAPAVPLTKSASIEQDLAFDQWEDEEEEEGEMVDMQISGSGDANDNAQEGSSEKTGDATPGSEADASPGQKDKVSATAIKPPAPKKIIFASLSDAIRSNASSAEEIRSLFKKEHGLYNVTGTGGVGVSKEDRAHLWTKLVCGKVLQDIEDGSLAESYREWEKKHMGEMTKKLEDGEYGAMLDSLLEQSCGMSKDDETYKAEKTQLLSLSYFHSRNKAPSSLKSSPQSSLEAIIDPLIPPVALAILRAGIPPAAASVVLSHIEPSAMPLSRLAHDEQFIAAKALHADFYLLACYHLPLLVMHLDRHCPGWYWPRIGNAEQDEKQEDDKPAAEENKEESINDEKKDEEERKDGGDGEVKGEKPEEAKDQKAEDDQSSPEAKEPRHDKRKDPEQNGQVPLSWFVTNFAGECSSGSCLDHNNLLPLWDNILTKGDHSWKYFLAIAVLEKNSDVLLMARGEDLKLGLEKILDFQETDFTGDSFIGEGEGNAETPSDDDMVVEWLKSAKSLVEATPSSVIELLRGADDRAVASALQVRQGKVDEELQAELDADEEARRKEREERDKESEKILMKVRLTAYYRQYNPEKTEEDAEKIMKVFDGRMGVLNEKLKKKYGKGFLPEEALKDQTRSFFMSVNQSITDTRKHVSVAVSERRKKTRAKSISDGNARSHSAVVLEVSTTEVIPVICTTKGHNLATGKKMLPRKRTSDTDSDLQFYLVDCRPESVAAEQGQFPTAVTLSPEKLQDPDELQKMTDMFESLRGAVHICVMGEGFASFPVLYNHTLSKTEQMLLEDDIARTSNCALFFLKKGFPFVSILRGGFAASHAFLSRETETTGMTPPDVLVDYDPMISLFAQLETARQEEDRYKNAPAREKTARTLQKIIDNSMTRLTIEEHRINNLANDLAKPETVDKMKQSASNFLAKAKTKSVPSIGFGKTPPLFMTKKFMTATAAANKDGEPSDTKVEPQAGEGSERPKSGVTSLTEKMKDFKLPSLHSGESFSTVDEKGKETSVSGSDETSLPPSSATTDTEALNEEKSLEEGSAKAVESSVNEKSTSKFVSSAFTSLTQRMQQQPISKAAAAPAAEPGESKPLDGAISATATEESTGSKMSFSSFANRIKQATVTENKVSEKKTDPGQPNKTSEGQSLDKESKQGGSASNDIPSKDGGSAGDITSARVSSALASFSQRMQKSKTATVAPASESAQPTSEGGDTAKKDGAMSKMSFASFTNRIKLVQQPVGHQQNQSEEEVEDEAKSDSKEKEGSATEESEGKEEPRSGEPTTDDSSESSKKEEHGPKDGSASADNAMATDGGRFTKFTKSLREKAAEVKISVAAEKKQESITEKSQDDEESNTADASSIDKPAADGVGRFSSFTKSMGGGFSGLRSNQQPSTTRPSPFANFYQSKHAGPTPDLTRKNSFGGKEQEAGQVVDSMSKTMAASFTSFGKLMLEDEPRPKTRFQRVEAEESISFDDGATADITVPSSTHCQDEGFAETNDEDLFADVPLTDDGADNEEKELANTVPGDSAGEEEKAETIAPADGGGEEKQPLDSTS